MVPSGNKGMMRRRRLIYGSAFVVKQVPGNDENHDRNDAKDGNEMMKWVDLTTDHKSTDASAGKACQAP